MKRKRKLKPRFYLFVSIAVLLIAGLAYLLWPSQLVTVSAGTIEYADSYDAVVIRDEKVYREDDFGKVNMLVGEGKTIAKDTTIAEVYQYDYSDRIIDELVDAQTAIYEYQEENIIKDLADKDLDSIRGKINSKMTEIQEVISGKSNKDMLALEEQLKELKTEESELLKQLSPTTDSKLNDLYKTERSVQERIDKSKTEVTAEDSGIISFYFDGMEEAVKADSVDNLTKSDIQDIIADKYTVSPGSVLTGTAIYRLINSHRWFVTFVGPRDGIKEMMVDQEYQITFEGIYDATYTGKLVSVRNADNSTIYVLQFDEDVSSLISVRATNIKIKKTFEGYKIKSSAITEQNGVRGVYAQMSYGKTFVKVDTVVDDGRNAIVEFVDTKMEDTIRIYE